MTEILLFLVGLFMGASLLFGLCHKKMNLLTDQKNALASELAVRKAETELLHQHLEEQREQAELQVLNLKEQLGEERERYEQAQKRTEEKFQQDREMQEQQFASRLQLMQEQLTTTTEQLLKRRTAELDKTNQTQMSAIVAPLKAVMTEMKKSMDDNTTSFSEHTGALKEQLKMMIEKTDSLGEEAEKLSKALQSGPKVQGDFGEMKLNELLEKFGFTKGLEYDMQYVMRDAKGKIIRNDDTNDTMRPDVVLHYPDKKDVIIDAKASLTAFIGYVNAQTEEERKKFLDEHVRSVRKHVSELADKQYNRYNMEGRQTLDFVIMFVPQESALQLALTADTNLWANAFERKVFITGGQNLFAVLRMLQLAWTQQRQTENQQRVFHLANTLVDRVGDFFERFDDINQKIGKLQEAYDNARRKLSGNQSLLTSARKLVDMGAKENPKHPLPKNNSEEETLPSD